MQTYQSRFETREATKKVQEVDAKSPAAREEESNGRDGPFYHYGHATIPYAKPGFHTGLPPCPYPSKPLFNVFSQILQQLPGSRAV